MMLRLSFVSVLFLMSVSAFSQEVSTEKPDTLTVTSSGDLKKTDTLVIQARLLEIPGAFNSNELYDYLYMFKYRVLKVEKGTYSDKEILVGHYNPLVPRSQIKNRKLKSIVKGTVKKFEAGGRHRLTLISLDDFGWNKAVEDNYEILDRTSVRYFAIITDDIKN